MSPVNVVPAGFVTPAAHGWLLDHGAWILQAGESTVVQLVFLPVERFQIWNPVLPGCDSYISVACSGGLPGVFIESGVAHSQRKVYVESRG